MQVATPETWEALDFTSLILDNKSKKRKPWLDENYVEILKN
jgi:hypothetical protein